jgi:hypothetical protein
MKTNFFDDIINDEKNMKICSKKLVVGKLKIKE